MKLRLILKVAQSQRTGPDTWQDMTGFQTFVIDAPESLYELLAVKEFSDGPDAIVVGAEIDKSEEAAK